MNNQKKIMRESEVHKFNDGTLTRIMEKLDHMVKDYVLFKFNRSMEHIIWSEHDKRRSKEFIEVIERRLKIRQIFRSFESFAVYLSQNGRDLPRDNLLVGVEVLRYDIKRSKSENKGITQQGSSHEVTIVVMDPWTQCTTLPSHSSEDENPARAIIKQALDALVLRTASAAAKPCQGDSSEFYLITGIPDGSSW
ncbi:hypothetical protein Tco_0769385 [Tanacetum coccineum]|uniref:Uncharacterized protein n=1 Tax=Tanacetum coccineum TaxID=301880 RepID=A0ABQ4Z983_9ASTR